MEHGTKNLNCFIHVWDDCVYYYLYDVKSTIRFVKNISTDIWRDVSRKYLIVSHK